VHVQGSGRMCLHTRITKLVEYRLNLILEVKARIFSPCFFIGIYLPDFFWKYRQGPHGTFDVLYEGRQNLSRLFATDCLYDIEN